MLLAQCLENPLVNWHQTICILLYVSKTFLASFQVIDIHKNESIFLIVPASSLGEHVCIGRRTASSVGRGWGPTGHIPYG